MRTPARLLQTLIFCLGLGGEIFEYLCPLPRVSFPALASRSSWVSRSRSLSASSQWRRSACLRLISACFLYPSRALSSSTSEAPQRFCLGPSALPPEWALLTSSSRTAVSSYFLAPASDRTSTFLVASSTLSSSSSRLPTTLGPWVVASSGRLASW